MCLSSLEMTQDTHNPGKQRVTTNLAHSTILTRLEEDDRGILSISFYHLWIKAYMYQTSTIYPFYIPIFKYFSTTERRCKDRTVKDIRAHIGDSIDNLGLVRIKACRSLDFCNIKQTTKIIIIIKKRSVAQSPKCLYKEQGPTIKMIKTNLHLWHLCWQKRSWWFSVRSEEETYKPRGLYHCIWEYILVYRKKNGFWQSKTCLVYHTQELLWKNT